MELRRQLEEEARVREMISQRLEMLETRTVDREKEGVTQKDIASELHDLRECFQELRAERDKLVKEMSSKLKFEER